MSVPGNPGSSPAEVLAALLAEMKSSSASTRLKAVQQAAGLPYSSREILELLEKLAVSDRSQLIREAARGALATSALRQVRQRINQLSPEARKILLNELHNLEKEGMISREVAATLDQRYGFDIFPAAPAPAPPRPEPPPPAAKPPPPARAVPTPAPTPKPAPAPAPAAAPRPEPSPKPAAPAPTLAQILLSETSIKIALYLGAFFVISAALILAALIAAARLPILLGVTILFGAGALALKKRLPQPSFILFVVFSALLPIDASVIASLAHLVGDMRAIFWTSALVMTAFVWGFGTWFYRSRFFSLCGYFSLLAAGYVFSSIFERSWPHLSLLMACLVGLTGLALYALLIRWQGKAFGQPLFWTIQATVLLWLAIALPWAIFEGVMLDQGSTLFRSTHDPAWLLASAAGLVAAAAFYVTSFTLKKEIPVFPWLAAVALLPVPWFGLTAFGAGSGLQSCAAAVWCGVFVLGAEICRITKMPLIRAHAWPLLAGSFVLTVLAGISAAFEEPLLALAVFTVVATAYTLASMAAARWYLWTLALAAWTAAYAALVTLPEIRALDIFIEYHLLIPGALYLLPDIVLGRRRENPHWRMPLRAYVVLAFAPLLLLNIIASQIVASPDMKDVAIIMGVMALLFAAHALRTRPWTWYVTMLALLLGSLALIDALDKPDLWLYFLTGLAVLNYLPGFFLGKSRQWSLVLRSGSLLIAAGASLVACFLPVPGREWCVLGLALLFLLETIWHTRWMEIIALAFLSIASALMLQVVDAEMPWYFLVFAVLWLGLDVALRRLLSHKRPWSLAVLAVGVLAVGVVPALGMTELDANSTWLTSLALAAFLLVLAFLHRIPWIGYAFSVTLAFSLLAFQDRFFYLSDTWLPWFSVLAGIYYLIGFMLPKAKEWSLILRSSGLGLAFLCALAAIPGHPEGSGWYVLGLGILFIAEAVFRIRWAEIAVLIVLAIAVCLLLDAAGANEVYYPMSLALLWLGLDLAFGRIHSKPRPWRYIFLAGGGLATLLTLAIDLFYASDPGLWIAAFVLAAFYTMLAFAQRAPWVAYVATLSLAKGVLSLLNWSDHTDLWLACFTGLAALYYAGGYLLPRSTQWSPVLRISGLALAGGSSLAGIFFPVAGREWLVLGLGILFVVETLACTAWAEGAVHLVLAIAVGLLLHRWSAILPYYALAVSLLWLSLDLAFGFLQRKRGFWHILVKGAGGMTAGLAIVLALVAGNDRAAWTVPLTLGLFCIPLALLHRQPLIGYATTFCLALSSIYLMRDLGWDIWLLPLIALSSIYYAVALVLSAFQVRKGWESVLRFSGLALATLTAFSAPFERSGLAASLPVAVAASLWAVEAFRRRNVWLGFPAAGLYLMSYFMILATLEVEQPQFYSVGAAALGMLMHYLLVRADSRIGAFLTGMVSQLVLLGTSYIQFVNTEEIIYFLVMFVQSLAVLVYGIIVRSRSLVITPIALVAVGVLTIIFGVLRGMSAVIIVGCTGMGLILLGIAALLLRERIGHLRDALKEWRP